VSLSPLGTSATNWLTVPASDDSLHDYGAFGGMRIGWRTRNTLRKPAPVLLCSPQIQHGLTWDRTTTTAVKYRLNDYFYSVTVLTYLQS
jgi:hypothetical protein